MSVETLVVLASNRIMGKVERDGDRLRFIYDERWRSADFAYPLSLSMPLAAAEHRHSTTEAFLWGLLPDNERTLEGWARRYQVSARNPFALLVHVGEDCPGAIQFCKPQRVGELLEDRAGLRKQAKTEGLKHPVLDRLVKLLVTRAKHCTTQLRPT